MIWFKLSLKVVFKIVAAFNHGMMLKLVCK
ncbi:hypothetical protein [Acinetobacter phage Ab69]|nr:hypothetical protein [Acinetobacter phage Ab69]